MLTCKSPRKVMRVAHELARRSLAQYSCRFSRHDFTLPQLFACLVVKEMLRRSYREAEQLLRDAEPWRRDIGMDAAPDHTTLHRAARFLLRRCSVNRLMDAMAQWAVVARILHLSTHPVALDSTSFESHHVSRHYERRCHQTRQRMKQKQAGKGRSGSRSQTVRRLPKLSIAVTSRTHWILALCCDTGAGGDQPYFGPLVERVRSRVPHRHLTVAADAGYDSEPIHQRSRQQGIRTLIPATSGRPSTRWRRLMHRMLGTSEGRKRSGYTQRYQVETVNSMIKRNLGSALRGTTAHSRKRDMALKVLTHNVMLLRTRVATEHTCPVLRFRNCLRPVAHPSLR
jgi:hypothetical protein